MVDRDETEDERKDKASEFNIAGVPLGPRTQHLLALEFGDRKDFDDPRVEWRVPPRGGLQTEIVGQRQDCLVIGHPPSNDSHRTWHAPRRWPCATTTGHGHLLLQGKRKEVDRLLFVDARARATS